MEKKGCLNQRIIEMTYNYRHFGRPGIVPAPKCLIKKRAIDNRNGYKYNANIKTVKRLRKRITMR